MLTSVPQIPLGTHLFEQMRSDAQVTPQVLALSCPRCGAQLGCINQWVGGRGFQTYDICTSPTCDYQKRQVS